MALDALALGFAIKTPLKAAHLAVGAADNAALEIFMGALASSIALAVVDHIKNNAVVLPLPALVAPPGGGPVTGTGSIT